MAQLNKNYNQRSILYLDEDSGVFGGFGDPNGVEKGGIGSIYSDLLTGNVYAKTTAFDTLTGWVLFGGGGGSGTVTSFSAGNLSPLFASNVTNPTTTPALTFAQISQNQNLVFASPNGSAGNPTFRALVAGDLPAGTGTVTGFSAGNLSPLFTSNVASPTTTPALTFAQIVQNANRVFAGPNTGAPANPTFRALVAADIPALASPPTNGIQYNDGTNGFIASSNFLFDPATATLQMGAALGITGKIQLRSSVSGSITHTVDNPAGNYSYIWSNSLLTNNDLLTVSVSGSNMTISGVARSVVSGTTINATDGVLPYRSSATAFSDSPLTRSSGTLLVSTATLQLPNGSVGTPALNFGSSGTGFYQNASSNITWADGGTAVFTVAPSSFKLRSAQSLNFTSGDSTLSSDTGLNRLGAGIIRINNGSTGAGQLVVGSSTASTSYQFLVDSQSTSRIAGVFTMPNGSSVTTIQGITNSIQSFAFFPTGKLVGGMNIPTANQQFSCLGNAKSDVSTIGNIGAGNDNLLAFALGANVLANTGDYVQFDAFGDFAANANNKTLQVVYGATTIFNTGAVAFNGSNWRMNVKILRTGSSAGKSIATFWSNDATTPFLQEIFITTEDFTASKTIQWKGESAASATDDIRQLHLESKLTVALTS